MFYGMHLSVETFYEMAQIKKVILFGASGSARTIINSGFLDDIDISYFCDNDENKWNKEFLGIKIYSPNKLLEENRDNCVVLITSRYATEIKKLLDNYGFHNIFYHSLLYPLKALNNIRDFTLKNLSEFEKVDSVLSDDYSKKILKQIVMKRLYKCPVYSDIKDDGEYFGMDFFEFNDEEVFVDAGVFDGDTIKEFIKVVDGKYKKVYGFEPNELNLQKARANFENNNKIEIIDYGLWDCNDTLKFAIHGEGSSISNHGSVNIKVTKLDDIVKEKVTFIKMDIEGAEIEAIKGAKETILRDKPKLAICVYHKLDDLYEIPLMIKKLVPEYKLFIRHHSGNAAETVLYATYE